MTTHFPGRFPIYQPEKNLCETGTSGGAFWAAYERYRTTHGRHVSPDRFNHQIVVGHDHNQYIVHLECSSVG